MTKKTQTGQRKSLLGGASLFVAAAAALSGAPAMAQDEEIVVTGTRITTPGVQSASPITTIGADEIALQHEPSLERILQNLPITLAADGQGVNNGTVGTETISLRGLGSNRNLILIDGRRLVPFGGGGSVDIQQVPGAFIDRIDIVTGGASAVYGSDAISGAINFVTKRDFEGVEFNYNRSVTGEGDGEVNAFDLNIGANVADGRGNVAMNVNYVDRDAVLFGARPLGRLGIVTADGNGLPQFLAGDPPLVSADPLCQGESAVDAAAGGSTTTLPTRIALVGTTAFGAGSGLAQFRTDGSTGENCSRFNFNPYNFYQTPLERFGGTAIARYEINEHAEVYGRLTFADTRVLQQIAPSGIFASTFFTNMDNPLIDAGVRAAMIAAAEGARAVDGTLCTAAQLGDPLFPNCVIANWVDTDGDTVVSAPDDLAITYRRRTVEFGPRSTEYNADTFQIATGVRGEIAEGWDYDVYLSHGRVNSAYVSAGYTNLTNLEHQTLTTDGVTCRGGQAGCVPLNLFGPLITDAAAIAYGSAVAIQRVHTEQTVFNAAVTGALPDPFSSPLSDSPIAVSFGSEYRSESFDNIPDECLKFQGGAGCLGGGGGTLPLAGEYDVFEVFGEAIVPLISDRPFFQSLDLELGYRRSDYSTSGPDDTYKYGVNWEPVDGLRVRAMRQRAARAANISELFTPVQPSLSNANLDPCSITNAAAFPDPVLFARCVATGVAPAQVGVLADGVVSGQVQSFAGTVPGSLPTPEQADTTTIGMVLNPDLGEGSFIQNLVVSLDWYKIEIADYVGAFGAQEVLDGCYTAGDTSFCDLIVRVGGQLDLQGVSGIQLFTRNLLRAETEGVELGVRFGVDMGNMGALTFGLNANRYLSNESQSSVFAPVIDCLGIYGTQCGNPLPETRFVGRTTWDIGDFQLSGLWRHLGEASIEPVQYALPNTVFEQFRHIDAYDYIDLSGAWNVTDAFEINASVTNLTEEAPPVLGNEAADTASNSGNTFPSVYDPLGRVFTIGGRLTF